MASQTAKRPSHHMGSDKENVPAKRPGPGVEAKGADPECMDLEDDLPQVAEEVEEGVLGEAGKNWRRPAPPPLDPSTQPLSEWHVAGDVRHGKDGIR